MSGSPRKTEDIGVPIKRSPESTTRTRPLLFDARDHLCPRRHAGLALLSHALDWKNLAVVLAGMENCEMFCRDPMRQNERAEPDCPEETGECYSTHYPRDGSMGSVS